VEFSTIRTALIPARRDAGLTAPPTRDEPALESVNYLSGVRVAEYDDLPGAYVVRVELLDSALAVVAQREVLVDLPAHPISVTVLLSRSCGSVVCPFAGGDPLATQCHGGQCVAPTCSDMSPESCGPAECTSVADCSPLDCVDATCFLGVCLRRVDDTACDPTMICNPETGCEPTLPPPPEPSCEDGLLNQDETEIDCGGVCPDCARWDTGGWGGCDRGTRTRSVRCLSGDTSVDASLCTEPRPSGSESCAWVEYQGLGGTNASIPEAGGLRLDQGTCTDFTACTGCSGGISAEDCGDHCGSLVETEGDITCVRTRCGTHCRVYRGHHNTGGPRPTYWGHAG